MKRFLRATISAVLLVCLLAGAMPEPFVASSAAAIAALAEEAKAHPVAEISALVAGAAAQAATTDGDGWIYQICPDGCAELIGYADAQVTSLTLPDTLGGAWVVRLAEDAFAENPNLHSVTIPAQIGEIPDSAFPVQQNMTVHALNGTAALAFAAKRGFSQRNESEYDFFDEILDLSELKPDQWSLSGSRLNLEAPYAQLVSKGTRLYLPPCGERDNGATVELSDCRMEGGGATASFVDLGFADAFESYRADGVSLEPDFSSFRSATEGVTLVVPRGVSVDVDLPKVIVSADVKLSQDYSFVGKIELTASKTDIFLVYEDYAVKEMTYDLNIGAELSGEIKTSKGTSWNALRRLPMPGQNARLVPDSRFKLGSFRLFDNKVISLWFDLDLVLSGNGEMKVEWGFKYTGTVTKAKDEFRPKLTNNRLKSSPVSWSAICAGTLTLDAAIVLRLGLSQEPLRTSIDVAKGDYSFGIEGKVQEDIINACADLTITRVNKAGWAVGMLDAHVAGKSVERWRKMGLRFKFSVGGTIWNDSVPLKSLHYESDDGTLIGNWSSVPHCTRGSVTAHFFPGYGATVPDQVVKRGSTLTEPSIAPRAGYSFQGWYKDANHVTPWDFASDVVQDDMTLYAYWVKYPEPENPPDMTVQPDGEGHGVVYVDQFYEYDTLFCRKFEYDYVPGGVEITYFSPMYEQNPFRDYTEEENKLIYDMYMDMWDEPYHVTVPSTIDGLPVVKIGGNSMFQVYNITGITLPDTVKEIAPQTFRNCSMTSIRLSKNLKDVPEYAFDSCRNLTSITLPDGITRIGQYAFGDCTKLTNITLPSGLREIVDRAFWGCSNLEHIELPDSITHIGSEAFAGSSITEIRTPLNWDEAYAISAFEGCYKLTSVVVPEGAKIVPAYSFYGCSGITSLQLPSTLEEIGSDAFRDCINLKEVMIPDSVVKLRGEAFAGTGISTIRMPVRWMEENRYNFYANDEFSPFEDCAALRTIIVPEGVTVIPAHFLDTAEVFGKVTDIQLPSTLVEIGRYAFCGCTSLEYIEIPDGVRSIGMQAFRGTALRSVQVPSNWEYVTLETGADERTSSPFYGCNELMYVAVPEGVRKIPAYAFAGGCGEYATIRFPSTLEIICTSAFDGAKFGPSLTIPASVCFLEPNSLRNSGYCKEITFEGDVAYIGENAFSGEPFERAYVHEESKNLRDELEEHAKEIILIPSKMHNVYLRNTGDSAMPSMMARSGALIGDPGVPTRAGFSFIGWFRDAACTLRWNFARDIMPNDDLTLYAGWESDSAAYEYSKTDDGVTIEGYEGKSSTVALPNMIGGLPVTAIAAEAIPDGVRSVSIPAGIRNIDSSAFKFAGDLAEIRVDAANEVYRVEDGALFKGKELIAVPRARASGSYDIPAGTEVIGSNAFYRCDALTQLNIPASVREIDDSAISECRALESVEFEADVERMGEGNLQNCNESLFVTGPVAAEKLTAYADENYLDYNIYLLGLVQDGELFAIITARAGDKLSELAGIDGGDARGFLGWSRTEDGSDIWNMEGAIMPAEDVLLYAVLCELFDYEAVNGGVRLTKYTGSASEIRVPDAVDGQPVVEIAEGCFPSNVTLIADRGSVAEAFAAAHGMNFEPLSYTLKFETNGGRKIPDRTLCATDPIDLPTPTRDGGAFQCWCTDAALSLPWNDGDAMPAHDLTLYASWSAQEDWVEIPFTFDELDGGVVITGYTGTRSTVSVPERINDMPVTAIANGAFENSEAHTVTLPATVRQIGEGAFAGSELSEIEMPGVTSIGARAFDGCTALSEVNIGTELTELGEGAFHDCGALTEIALPDGLTALGEDVFSGCDWLASVTLPANLSAIPSGTFQSCRRLRAIRLGAQVRSVASDAFDGCAALAEIAVEGGNMYYKAESNVLFNASGTQLMLYPQGKADEEYAIPSGVTLIATGAMQGARMKTLRLNAELERIGADALRDCAYLERIEMNGALDEIGARAFVGCMSLADVTLPESVEIVGEEAFDSAGLTRIYVPAQTQLGSNAIPARIGLTIYGHRGSEAESYAQAQGIRFLDESSDIPVTGIALSTDTLDLEPGQTATLTATLTPGDTTEKEIAWFSDNEAVAFVSQSGEVEARGVGEAVIYAMAANGAMAQCALRVTRRPVKAEEIVLSAQSIVLSLGDMRSVSATVLPAGAEDAAVTWSVENPDIADWIGGCVMGKSIGQTTLTATTAGGLSASCAIKVIEHLEIIPMDAPDFLLPDSLTAIEAGAFTGLAMTVISCPNGLREIGSRAFANCGKLKQIYIPPSATSIAEDAFEGCGAGLIIYGEYGTAAESFAEAHGYGFREMA